MDELLGGDADAIRAAAAVSSLARLIAGELSCATVRNGPLFLDPITNDVYAVCRQAIEDFCSLPRNEARRALDSARPFGDDGRRRRDAAEGTLRCNESPSWGPA